MLSSKKCSPFLLKQRYDPPNALPVDDAPYLLIPGIGWGSPTGIDEALDVTTGCLIQARDGPAP
jgi:hypothetical protein